MARQMTQRDRERLIEMAEKATALECKRRRIPCWNRAGTNYTAEAQNIFNNAYDHFEIVIKNFLGR